MSIVSVDIYLLAAGEPQIWGKRMATEKTTTSREGISFLPDAFSLDTFSLDTWAVIAALVLALAVRFDLLKNVAW